MKPTWLLCVCLLIAGCTKNEATSDADGSADVDLQTGPASEGTASESGGPALGSGPANAPFSANADATPVPIDGGEARLSAENTQIQFVGKHVDPSRDDRTGVFTEFAGRAEVDAASSTLKAVSVEIQTESLTTPIPNLTNHLKQADFFEVREYPTARFESTSISAGAGDQYTVTGDLTLHGATKEISFPAQVTINDDGLTLVGSLTLDRTEFGMDRLQEQVVKEVGLTVVIGQASELPPSSNGGFSGRGGGGRPDAAAIFARMDVDSDGSISGDEIPSWMANNLAVFDSNSDGAISLEELQEQMSRFGRGGGAGRGIDGGGSGFDPAAIFARRDENSDGKLTGDEISDRMRENLEAMDTDSDGAVTLEEFQARMRAFGGDGGRRNRPERPSSDE